MVQNKKNVWNLKKIQGTLLLYMVCLLLYDIVVWNKGTLEILHYIKTAVIIVICCVGIYGVVYIQIKNPFCSKERLKKILNLFLILFALSSVIMGIRYFMQGFTTAAYIAPLGYWIIFKIRERVIQEK